MVNEVILDYLKKYKGEYDLEELKEKIISAGYSSEELAEALSFLGLEKPQEKEAEAVREVGEEILEETDKTSAASATESPEQEISSMFASKFVSKNNPPAEMFSSSYYRWLKIAGLSGIAMVVLGVLFAVFNSGILGIKTPFSSSFSFVVLLLSLISLVLFYYGFLSLGKSYSNNLVKFASYAFIIFTALIIVLQNLLMIYPDFIPSAFLTPLNELAASASLDAEIYSQILSLPSDLLISLLLVWLIFLLLNVILGIGLIKLREVKHSKIAGILQIIGACLLIVGIGLLGLFAAFIFEIILLLKEGRKG